jgi:hypothetical protein
MLRKLVINYTRTQGHKPLLAISGLTCLCCRKTRKLYKKPKGTDLHLCVCVWCVTISLVPSRNWTNWKWWSLGKADTWRQCIEILPHQEPTMSVHSVSKDTLNLFTPFYLQGHLLLSPGLSNSCLDYCNRPNRLPYFCLPPQSTP